MLLPPSSPPSRPRCSKILAFFPLPFLPTFPPKCFPELGLPLTLFPSPLNPPQFPLPPSAPPLPCGHSASLDHGAVSQPRTVKQVEIPVDYMLSPFATGPGHGRERGGGWEGGRRWMGRGGRMGRMNGVEEERAAMWPREGGMRPRKEL